MTWMSKKYKSLLAMLLISLAANAQEVEMATGLRASGKIYVVVAVLATIFTGIVVYLISLDRRIKRLEKENKA